MKPALLCIGIWILCASVHIHTSSKPVFGVRIAIGANSEMLTYACFINNGRTLTQKRVVDRQTFIRIISGFWPSPYNPGKINYFQEHNLDCSVYKDSLTLEEFPTCIPFDSLWKVRFSTYPFRGRTDMGWSAKLQRPSLTQEKYIYERYGVKEIDGEFFMDTSFWLLLNDVIDEDWIANYKSLE